ncbi:21157_t:CDS:2, partial [Gigaspora margarita]
SFRTYMLTREESKDSSASSSSRELFKFFNKLLVGQSAVPEFILDNYILFSIVKLKDGSATYLGLLDKWYLMSKIEIVGKNRKSISFIREKKAETATESQVLEGMAYKEKEDAIRAKGKRDFQTSSRCFLSAAKYFQKIGDDYNLLEAAGCYEDAYKSLQQLNQLDKALKALETAASIYEKNDRQHSRAARTYESLAEQHKKITNPNRNLEKALAMHKKAAELFELDSDGRYLFSLISQAELSAELGYYEQGIILFEQIAATTANDSLLNFRVKDHVFWQCLCIIALDDWVRLEKQLAQSSESYPSFTDSRECEFVNSLIAAKNSYDPSAFATACKKYDQLTKLTPWQTNILLKAKKGLEVEDL